MAIRKDTRTDREKSAAAVGLTVAQLDAMERKIKDQADTKRAKAGADKYLRNRG